MKIRYYVIKDTGSLDYFKELKNLNIDVGDRIPINEMCKRCDNGYHYTNEEYYM